MSVRVYEIRSIHTYGANTEEAVSIAASLAEKLTLKKHRAGKDIKTILNDIRSLFVEAGSEMFERESLMWYLRTIAENIPVTKQDMERKGTCIYCDIELIEDYIVSNIGWKSNSRCSKELLSSKFAHNYVSLVVGKFKEALAK